MKFVPPGFGRMELRGQKKSPPSKEDGEIVDCC